MKIVYLLPLGIAAAGIGVPPSSGPARADPKEVSKDIIAVQLRRQGFECKNPESAKRDPAAARPDEAAWILKCEGVTYKVQLVPNMAAKVERLPDEQQSIEQQP